MSLVQIVISNIKKLSKNPTVVTMSILLPIISIIAVAMLTAESKDIIYIIDESKSIESEDLINALEEKYDIKIFENEDDIEKQSLSVALLEISKEYSKESLESINIKELVPSNKSKVLYMEINNYITNYSNGINEFMANDSNIKVNVEKDNAINSIGFLVLIYYGFLGSTSITEDILKLKVQNVLKRAVTTPNKDWKILFGLFFSAFLFLSIPLCIIFVIGTKFISMLSTVPILNGIIAILLITLVSVAMMLFIVRWFKNPNLITGVSTIVGVLLFSLGLFGVLSSTLSAEFFKYEFIAYISPFYWAAKIVEGDLILGSIVLLLISTTVFTAGSFRLKKFAIQ